MFEVGSFLHQPLFFIILNKFLSECSPYSVQTKKVEMKFPVISVITFKELNNLFTRQYEEMLK